MTDAERLTDTLRAEAYGLDLQEDGTHGGLRVCAMRTDGSRYQLGWVSEALVYQDPQAARAAIERIKFARVPRVEP